MMNHSDEYLANISSSDEDETCLSRMNTLDHHILISCASSCHENKFRAKSGPLPIPRVAYLNRCMYLELDQRKQMYDYSTWQMYNRITNFRKSQPDCCKNRSFKDNTIENARHNGIDSTCLCAEKSRIISTLQIHLSAENDSSEEDDIFYFEM